MKKCSVTPAGTLGSLPKIAHSACVKDTKSHSRGECPRPTREVPHCCNYGQTGHPIDYRGCLAYNEMVARKEAVKTRKTKKFPRIKQTVTQLSQSLTSPGVSNAQAAKKAIPTYSLRFHFEVKCSLVVASNTMCSESRPLKYNMFCVFPSAEYQSESFLLLRKLEDSFARSTLIRYATAIVLLFDLVYSACAYIAAAYSEIKLTSLEIRSRRHSAPVSYATLGM